MLENLGIVHEWPHKVVHKFQKEKKYMIYSPAFKWQASTNIWLVERPRFALFYSQRFFAEDKSQQHFGPLSVHCDYMDCTQAFAHLNYAHTNKIWVLSSKLSSIRHFCYWTMYIVFRIVLVRPFFSPFSDSIHVKRIYKRCYFIWKSLWISADVSADLV